MLEYYLPKTLTISDVHIPGLLLEKLSIQNKGVLLDAKYLCYMDLAGVGIILFLHDALAKRGFELAVRNISGMSKYMLNCWNNYKPNENIKILGD